MILFLFGKETFLLKRKLNQIIKYYKKKHKSGLNLHFLDLKEKSFEDFKAKLKSSPMFSEKKFFILENASSNQNFKEKFLREIESFKTKDFVILFLEEKDVSKDKFFQELKKHSRFQEFKPLDFQRLKIWVLQEFKKYGKEIEEKAVFRLIELVGKDLWALDNEIQKLVNFKKGGKIELEDVEELVGENVRVDVFKAMDAISQSNKKKALKILNLLFEKGENPISILSLLKLQFKNLLLIKDLMERGKKRKEIFQAFSFHPFFFEKIFSMAKNFEKQKLKEVYFKIFELEEKIKSGKSDPRLSLELFLFQI